MDIPVTTPDNGHNVEQVLYAKRQKIYPREVHGLFAYLRTAGVIVLLGLFYGVAWLQWDGRQAVLWDLPARKFYVWGLIFWPQDFIYLALLLIMAGLSLFFFTTLAGRLWCGYACPQTVWTETFLWIERMVEGNRPQQMKLDREPWSTRKLRIKGTKHFLWIAFALWTGFTFVGYFTPIRELATLLPHFSAGPWATFWVFFYAFATYGNAGWMREQVCLYMCPYARFQSAMFDKDTLVVSYDQGRGEPRGSRKRSIDHHAAGLGDCIDCGFCVQVCPTGIDIRKGLQYECISCSACIDACDSVMDTMGYEHGLIRYTTQQALEGKPTRILRPRVFIYASLLLALGGGLTWSILARVPLALDAIRDRNQLYRETDAGKIENVYALKVMNMDTTAHEYMLSARGIEDLELKLEQDAIAVAPGEIHNVVARLEAEVDDLEARSTPVFFTLTAIGYETLTVTEEARFLGPKP
ncbi:MAG: cytochrome c oxidase accessory protein CcoG [Gammaproteobacteria bacterium RIFCSPLOWO2_02_FULL_61_13]|nr:MAG: cytochrome c oxidase accessory protein CcoG [Gammaproteobacteria bacterium RIFCSPLOWO2_02_FULL_61_13]